MKYFIFYAIAILMFSCAVVIFAEDDKDDQNYRISPGLESVRVTDAVTRLTPRGAEAHVEGGIVKVESTSGFVGRTVEDLQKRVNLLEQKHKEMENSIAQLQLKLQQMEKDK